MLNAGGSAFAAGAAAPDPTANGALAAIIKEGGKVFYLGNDHALNGWFAVENGVVQILYQTPDNKGVVAGSMFGPNNERVTPVQVAKLIKDNKEVADMIEAAKKATDAAAQTSATPLGERLMHDLQSATTIVIGKASSPEILMVMDTHCLHCQATWKMIRDRVFKGDVHLRLIPIGDANSDSERAAAVFVGIPDPINTWNKYIEGDHAVLDGTPSDSAVQNIRANHVLIDKWNVQMTPYLVYRGKDSKVKILQGEPENVSTLLADMGL
jgi:hypothetical protein